MLTVNAGRRVYSKASHPYALRVTFDWSIPWSLVRYYATKEERAGAALDYAGGFLFIKDIEEIDCVGAKESKRPATRANRGASQGSACASDQQVQASV